MIHSAIPGRMTAGPAANTESPQFLGPGRVLPGDSKRPGTNQLMVELDDELATQVEVAPAFTFPYQPVTGDRLLVLGNGTQYFAVGVLGGQGPSRLHFPGDVSLHAVDGKLTLASDQAIQVRAPKVTIRAGILRTIVDNVTEKAGGVRRWVRGLLAVRAGQSRRVIDGQDTTRCENSTTLAKDTVTIDGDQLHLGH